MSLLLRLARSQGIKSRLTLVTPKDTTIYNKAHRSNSAVQKDEKEELYEVKKPWVSYGFDDTDIKKDRQSMHMTYFVTISVCLVFGAVAIGYAPDPLLKDWAQREAYLQLRHREENGLPLIDRNLIDPSKVILPSEEELLDVEIII